MTTETTILFIACIILIILFSATFSKLLAVQEERRQLEYKIYSYKVSPEAIEKLQIIGELKENNKELKRENSQLRSRLRRAEEKCSMLRIINSESEE